MGEAVRAADGVQGGVVGWQRLRAGELGKFKSRRRRVGEGGEEVVTKLLDDVARSEATEIRRRVATIASKAEEDERRCVQPVQHTTGITYMRCMEHMEITI